MVRVGHMLDTMGSGKHPAQTRLLALAFVSLALRSKPYGTSKQTMHMNTATCKCKACIGEASQCLAGWVPKISTATHMIQDAQ